jgi:hypothetical protein
VDLVEIRERCVAGQTYVEKSVALLC